MPGTRTFPLLLKLNVNADTNIQEAINMLNRRNDNINNPRFKYDTISSSNKCIEFPSCQPNQESQAEETETVICADSTFEQNLPTTTNKYLIIIIDRATIAKVYNRENEISVTPDPILKFGDNTYIISGCIIRINNNHFFYMKFDKESNSLGLVDDLQHEHISLHKNEDYKILAKIYVYRLKTDADADIYCDSSNSRQKYLKYKEKYLKLKNKLNL